MQENRKYAAPAVEKAFDILECLAEQPLPMSQTEIAKKLGRSSNEIYRVLVNLEERGYLIREGRSGAYRVSLKLYNLSRSIFPIEQIRRCAMPHMDDFAVKTGMSCHLCMLYQSQTMVIVHASSPSPVSLNIAEGTLFSTLGTASGNILLANSKKAVQDMLLARSADFRVMPEDDKARLPAYLKKVRTEALAYRKDALATGVESFATLIGEPEGKIIASLAVSYIQSQVKEMRRAQTPIKDDIIEELMRTARLINDVY